MKLKSITIILLFLCAIFFSTFTVNKYDKYETSSDKKNNHSLIKGDVHKFWKEANFIKKQYENKVPFYELGQIYYNSYLPPKLIAAYYIIISEELYLEKYTEDNKPKVKSNNKKNYFIYIQIIIFFFSLMVLSRSLKKNYLEISTICIFFLILEPTINQFHYSFFSESIFFSLTILLLSQIAANSKNIANGFLIGIIIGAMYLQRSVAILYFFPVLFYFILEKKSFKYFFSYIMAFIIVLSFLGFHNYKRSGVVYFTPLQSKHDFYKYLLPNIAKQKNYINSELEMKKIKNHLNDFRLSKNLDLKEEKSLINYSTYVRNISFKYMLENPVDTIKVIIKKNLHASIMNPFEIYSFYKYEYKAKEYKFRYYQSREHKKHLKIRATYSIIIYLICLVGIYAMIKKNKDLNFLIYLIISIAYFSLIGGWVGNPRYLTPNIIFLSIFFAYGFIEIKNKLLKNIKNSN